ncbi:hypothetical protein BU23DRAFT_567005 [Bimuria novae-zelandiae CBS 107.79]|uniref:Heterokaryon incompatibility domain-containing protein n=1 Tax=Bimuria novae-zelandiae CBS 107.79 TaxID=1447943 RepID=A0A6A5VC21_9PLEO|nr:hypothetical protein BU23DRAFT_567005 [Bimuria novae-zelandiae CBS 107.79]
MLCAICISMFQGPHTEGDHHSSFGNLFKAAQSGCKICKALLLSREELGPDKAGERKANPFISFKFVSGKFIGLDSMNNALLRFSAEVPWLDSSPFAMPWKEVQLHVGNPQAAPQWWSSFLKDTRSDLLTEPWRVRKDELPLRHIPNNTGEVEVARLALDWLTNRRDNHKLCDSQDRLRSRNFYPPRLLEISSEMFQICRLITTKDVESLQGTSYVALSHCWGNIRPTMTLTAENKVQMERVIPWHKLPKSFQEAIQTCSHLAHAMGSTQGCFVHRDADFLQTASTYAPVSMNLGRLMKDADEPEVVDSADKHILNPDVRWNLVTIFAGHHHDFRSSLMSRHPLNRRGWVFQERLMSPRTLHFGKDRVYWECNEAQLNEYLPWDFPAPEQQLRTHAMVPFSLPDRVLDCDPIPDSDHKSIIAKNKLTAISAITKRFGEVLPGTYASGFFFVRLPYGLLWKNISSQTYTRMCVDGCMEEIIVDAERDPVYRAPSWSWASVDGRTLVARIRTISCSPSAIALAKIE